MNKTQIDTTLRAILSDLFEINAESIVADNNSDTISAWDSLGQLQLFMALEEAYKVKFQVSEISSQYTVGELLNLICEKLDVK
jgi:acyl carrier protein